MLRSLPCLVCVASLRGATVVITVELERKLLLLLTGNGSNEIVREWR